MVQHHRTVMLCRMRHPEPGARQSLIVIERSSGNILIALKRNGLEVDKAFVLLETDAALAPVNDQGILHGDVRAKNIIQIRRIYDKAVKFRSFALPLRQTQLSPRVRCRLWRRFMWRPRCRSTHAARSRQSWIAGRSVSWLWCYECFRTRRICRWKPHWLARRCINMGRQYWDSMVRILVKACVKPEEDYRPLTKEVYLPLAGAVFIDEKLAVEQDQCGVQFIPERSWQWQPCWGRRN